MKKSCKRVSYALSVIAVLSALCGCSGPRGEVNDIMILNNGADTKTAGSAEKNKSGIRAVRPADGDIVSLLNAQMTGWVKEYKPAQLDTVCDFTEKCEPVPVTLAWEDDNDTLYSHVLLSVSADMSEPTVHVCKGNALDINDLYTGERYYWQVISECPDKTVLSPVFSFDTMKSPRTVEIDGVSNVRDIGGAMTFDGRRVKQGMAYRGADLSGITQDGIEKAVSALGIKTELDLRNRTKADISPLGERVNYISVSAPWYAGAFDETYYRELADALRVFADADNYPVYFHCSLGRDRTGTLTFFLKALCGESMEDILMDYEISFFSDLGGYNDRTAPSVMVNGNLLPFAELLLRETGQSDIYHAARVFLTEIGLTDPELDAIRANLLTD